MIFAIPSFIPVPSPGTMQMISIFSLIAGICFVGAGLLFLFLNKKKERNNILPWVFLCVGLLLMANHGLQLLF